MTHTALFRFFARTNANSNGTASTRLRTAPEHRQAMATRKSVPKSPRP